MAVGRLDRVGVYQREVVLQCARTAECITSPALNMLAAPQCVILSSMGFCDGVLDLNGVLKCV